MGIVSIATPIEAPTPATVLAAVERHGVTCLFTAPIAYRALAGELAGSNLASLRRCVSAGEFHREINSVSVPLIGPDGEVMALNCGGAAFAFTEERLRLELAPRLIAMALTIAAEIGGSVPNLPH